MPQGASGPGPSPELRIDVEGVAPGTWRIDTFERGRPGRAAAYAVDGGSEIAIVETGTNAGVPSVVAGLRAAGLSEDRVTSLWVTHVHLDHAGGLGALAERWRGARVFVHPRGARHVIDPSRLESSARTVYGDAFDRYFGHLRGVAAERVVTPKDGERVQVGDRELVALHTPGHAPHHMMVEDTETRGVFTGDGAGIRYANLWPWGLANFHLPTSSPPSFDPDVMGESIGRVLARAPERLYFTHFGLGEPAEPYLVQCREDAQAWGRLADGATGLGETRDRLRSWIEARLRAGGVGDLAAAWEAADLDMDLDLDSQGLWVYVNQGAKRTGSSPT